MHCGNDPLSQMNILTADAHMRADNAKTVPSETFRGGGQHKLPGFRFGGPRSGIHLHSLEVFSNYSGAVCTSSVTVTQRPLFRQLGPCSRVWSLRGWIWRSLWGFFFGEQWLLYTEWGPEMQDCLSVGASQETATHTRRG